MKSLRESVGHLTEKTTRTVLTARPGWYAVTYYEDGQGNVADLCEDAVIAWIVEHAEQHDEIYYAHAIPVTADGVERGCYAIKDPGGRYSFPCDRSFTDKAGVLGYFKEIHDARCNRVKKATAA